MTPETLDNLNRIAIALDESLAHYLHDALPYLSSHEDEAAAVLQVTATDQQETVDRIGSFILENGGSVTGGRFPIQYSALHDLSFDYLLPFLIKDQQRIIDIIESCVAGNYSIQARAMAEEALGQARAHKDSFEELHEETLGVATRDNES